MGGQEGYVMAVQWSHYSLNPGPMGDAEGRWLAQGWLVLEAACKWTNGTQLGRLGEGAAMDRSCLGGRGGE